MALRVTLPSGVELAFEQVMALNRLMDQAGKENVTWHPNACGCCIVAHIGDDDAYLIDQCGGATHYKIVGGEPIQVSELTL